MSILCERIPWCRFKAFYLNDVAENMVHPGMMKDSFYLWFFHFSSWIICFLPPAKCLQFNKIVFEVHTIYMYKVVNYHWSLTYCVEQECLFITGVHVSYNQKCERFDQHDLSDALLESWDVDIAYDILMEVVIVPFLQVNALIAGAVTGAAIAAGTQRWTQVIGVAGIVSAFSAAADYSRTNWVFPNEILMGRSRWFSLMFFCLINH